MTTQELIALLDKLDKEATPAPWLNEQFTGKLGVFGVAPKDGTDDDVLVINPLDPRDSRLIVTLRNNLTTLLNALRVVDIGKELQNKAEIVADEAWDLTDDGSWVFNQRGINRVSIDNLGEAINKHAAALSLIEE